MHGICKVIFIHHKKYEQYTTSSISCIFKQPEHASLNLFGKDKQRINIFMCNVWHTYAWRFRIWVEQKSNTQQKSSELPTGQTCLQTHGSCWQLTYTQRWSGQGQESCCLEEQIGYLSLSDTASSASSYYSGQCGCWCQCQQGCCCVGKHQWVSRYEDANN
jgi:hypothetical protein